jgi:ribose 1,5-bisphosphokinase
MPRYPGVLVYLVGASGAGKDSLLLQAHQELQAAKKLDGIVFLRRHITRPANCGNENHIALEKTDFERCMARGDFILHWQSHGLQYGVHRHLIDILERGDVAVLNGSRVYLPEVIKRIEPLLVVEVCVSKDILRQRLEQRGRESGAALAARLARAATPLPAVKNLLRIDNSCDLAKSGHILATILLHAHEHVHASTEKK